MLAYPNDRVYYVFMVNTTTTQAEYVAMVLGWGRKEMLRLLNVGGLKQGNQKRTDAELAEILWVHFGSRKGGR